MPHLGILPATDERFRSTVDAIRGELMVDGLVLRYGHYRGVLLPQVWERRATVREFVEALKGKAGLFPGFWADGIEILRFTLSKFSGP
jgi:AMMECR1 domain-containing protein